MNRNKLTAFIACVCLLSGCQSSSHLVEFKSAHDAQQLSNGEKRLWSQSDDAVRTIARSGKLLKDNEATAHINSMAHQMYPEFKDEIEIEIVKTPILNAFAFPNGRLFIHSGIIAAAQNDSQLAAVVAHEVAHFTKRHSAKNRISAANATSFIVFMNVMGIPLLGEIIGVSSIAGFSRDLEREADMEAIVRMKKYGYDITDAKKIFEFMASDALANDYESPWFFASHPDLIERIESFDNYVMKQGDTAEVNPDYQNSESYRQIFKDVRKVAMEEKLEIGHFSSLINEYENFYLKSIYNQNSDELFYFANAYRLRDRKGDHEKALTIFDDYIQNHKDNPDAYMHAGVVCMDLGNFDCARERLLKAKEISQGSNGYINMYMKKLESMELKNES